MSFLIILLILLSSCATATPVPYDATGEQLDRINAMNVEATAKNTSILAGIQVAAVISGFVLGLLMPAALY